MSKRFIPTVITPEIEKKLDEWQEFANKHTGIMLSQTTNIPFCAKTTVETGHCNCHPDRICPCEQMWDEIKHDGYCFCKVFWANTNENPVNLNWRDFHQRRK